MKRPFKRVSIGELKKHLKNGVRRDDIAAYMGYATSSAITNWLFRGTIPKWQQPKLKEFFDGLKNN